MNVYNYTCLLREYRMRAGLSQEELAELVGVSQNTISNLELCLYRPSLELAFKLGLVFVCDPFEIFIFKVLL